jgi:hypothetical protein
VSRARWIVAGVTQLVGVVLLSLLLAALGYAAILAVITLFPPQAIQ